MFRNLISSLKSHKRQIALALYSKHSLSEVFKCVCACAELWKETWVFALTYRIVLCSLHRALFLSSSSVAVLSGKFSVLYCIGSYWALAQHDSCNDKGWSRLVNWILSSCTFCWYFGTSNVVPWSLPCTSPITRAPTSEAVATAPSPVPLPT